VGHRTENDSQCAWRDHHGKTSRPDNGAYHQRFPIASPAHLRHQRGAEQSRIADCRTGQAGEEGRGGDGQHAESSGYLPEKLVEDVKDIICDSAPENDLAHEDEKRDGGQGEVGEGTVDIEHELFDAPCSSHEKVCPRDVDEEECKGDGKTGQNKRYESAEEN